MRNQISIISWLCLLLTLAGGTWAQGTQNWDASTSTPSGWTMDSAFSISTYTHTSAPNAVEITTPGAVYTAYTTSDDGLGGNVHTTFNAYWNSLNDVAWGMIRCSGGAWGSTNNYYWTVLPNGALRIVKRLSGTDTVLATGSAGAISASLYYKIHFIGNGSALSLGVQRLDNNNWLQSDNTYAASPAYPLSVTDSSITGAGKIGFGMYGVSSTPIMDDITWAAATGASYAFTNAAFSYSPDNWYQAGTYAQADACGADVDLVFSGTSLACTFDTSPLTGNGIAAPSTSSPAAMSTLPAVASDPVLMCIIDNGPPVYAQEAATVQFATGLSSGTHTARIMEVENDYNVDGWTTPVSDPRFTGIALDSGASISAPTEPSLIAIAFGDSILEGLRSLGINTTYTDQDASLSWVWPLEQALGVRLGIIGYGGTSFNQSGQRNVPGLSTSYALHDASHSRLVSGHFAQIPNYVFCEDAVNGTPVQSDVTSALNSVAAAAPGATFVQILPFSGSNYATVKAGALAAGWLLADTAGSGGIAGLSTATGTATRLSSDGIHPLSPLGEEISAAAAAQSVRKAITPAGGTKRKIQ